MPKTNTQHGPLERHARATLREAGRSLARLERACGRAVAEAAEVAIASLEAGGTIYFCGNGGSAADSQHLAAELSGRYLFDRPPLASIALGANKSAMTAIGNDYGFDQVFSRELEGLGIPGDVLVAITTSGGSANVRKAVQVARRLGMTVIGFTGRKGAAFAATCDVALVTPSDSTPRVQEGHITMGHTLCELIERALFGSGRTGAAARGTIAGRGVPAAARATLPARGGARAKAKVAQKTTRGRRTR